ncbi:MAG TPA: UDP-3-O-acyl-N-acetylglucosamine deacetylase [Polyangiaceae bacterium]|jgi:UDP-3-O-[3-hydroxymyristoyl] N-acetylglucosamine deacetylase
MRDAIVVEGLGLHAGAPGRVTLRPFPGETTLNGHPISRFRAVRAERSTAIVCDAVQARTVEHLFAALAALGLREGVALTLSGPEPPILDGGAAAWFDQIAPLGIPATRPSLRVARAATVEVGLSRYAFVPGFGTVVSAHVEMGDDRVAADARWAGEASDFRERIAPARTFCFAHEVEALARSGLASHVTPEMVVVIGDEILASGRPFEPDEPVRHKVLDLIGDLFLYGGPPIGEVAVHRPGHWSTHEAMRRALLEGIVGPVAGGSSREQERGR